MAFLFVVVVILCLLAAIKVYNKLTHRNCTSTRDMTGKVVVITGGNTGIGKATVMDLARRNAKVIMGCRDLTRARQAASDVIKVTGNTKVSVIELNLSSLQSIRRFSEELKKTVSRIDVLINNAGITGLPARKLTEDNLEMTFAINYFGPFYLTHLLLDLLKRSSPSRIVNVSSLMHRLGTLRLDNLNSERQFNKYTVYGDSKLAMTVFTKMLADKLDGTGVTANSLHPGAVNTDLFRKMPKVMQSLTHLALWLFFKTPEEGAQTTIHLAVAEELAHVSGKYFAECAVAKMNAKANNEQLAWKLWNISEQLVKIDTYGKPSAF